MLEERFGDNSGLRPMEMLYHGSKLIVKNPAYGKGNPENDYGLGF